MKRFKISESFLVFLLLALSGGLMDAYSYIARDHVFANAQTGNIILFGINIFDSNKEEALKHLFPILAFTLGIILSEVIKRTFCSKIKLHWSQIVILTESIILFFVSFIDSNLIANSLTSFACGIQVESFRILYDNSIATTMCIGNLRTGTWHLVNFLNTKDFQSLKNSLIYFGIIFFFILGAILGKICILYFNMKAIIISSLILFLLFILIEYLKTKVSN